MEIQHIKTQDIVKANIYGKFIVLNIKFHKKIGYQYSQEPGV